MSESVFPGSVTETLVMTVEPDVQDPLKPLVEIVPQPPLIVKLLLIIVSPRIVVSPVTELTTNTSLSVPFVQSLEILNFCCSATRGVITLITSP